MPSDYELIRKENMREYGEGTRHLDFLQQLYADRTHFIYELLQNAEDARASRIAFTVHHDRLVVHHDGRPFNEQDVRGICGVNASTKDGDLTRIGKFGIGFKSVYAYTLAPEVHSGSEHFRIRHYVRPEAVGDLAGSDAGITTFVFPFDRSDVPVEVAHREISSGLHALNPEALLFLRNLERVTVHAGSGTIVLSRRQAQDDVRNVELVVSQNDRVISHQYWQVFRRGLERVGYPGQRVEIAFKRAGAAHEAPVERVPRAPLVVYFPTDKPTGLGFLLQAPLRTTPARDNVAEYDPDNAKLVAEAAQLLLDALEEMRHEGRLGLDVFQVLPIVPEEFPEGSLLRPLFDTLRDAVRTHPLLPVAGTMRHAPAANVRLARVAGLRELLTPEQLGALAGTAGALQWQHERLTRDRASALWDYLRHVIGVDEVTPEWVVLQLNQGFLEKADDSWLIRLYNFLAQSPALWRQPRGRWERPGLARATPIIRLEDGSHVVPFGPDGRPLAHLPGAAPSSFPTVRRSVALDRDARAFLEDLGLSEPDIVDEVLANVLPRYHDMPESVDNVRHDADLLAITQAMDVVNGERRTALIEALRSTPFLRCRKAGATAYSFQRPQVAYWPDPDVEHYFLPSPEGWFLDERYEAHRRHLAKLGVADRVRTRLRPPNNLGHVTIRATSGDHYRGLHGFDPDLHIDGLAAALARPDARRSAYVWNQLLLPHAARLRGTVETATRVDYSNGVRSERVSEPFRLATTHSWLLPGDGGYVEPGKLTIDDLPPEFARDQTLADALGLISSVVGQASAELNVPISVLRYLAENPEAVAELELRRATEQTEPTKPTTAGLSADEYANALQDSFEKPAFNDDTDADPRPRAGHVAAPEIRRERTREAISQNLADEPAPQNRFRVIGRKVWDGKNPAVRQFLLEQYAGCCQICTATFPKRNGDPYFEVLHLVSSTAAAWIDRPGNALSLCPTCTSKFLFGDLESSNLVEQILRWRALAEGGSDNGIRIRLCGQPVLITYTEKHLLDLQEMVTFAQS